MSSTATELSRNIRWLFFFRLGSGVTCDLFCASSTQDPSKLSLIRTVRFCCVCGCARVEDSVKVFKMTFALSSWLLERSNIVTTEPEFFIGRCLFGDTHSVIVRCLLKRGVATGEEEIVMTSAADAVPFRLPNPSQIASAGTGNLVGDLIGSSSG